MTRRQNRTFVTLGHLPNEPSALIVALRAVIVKGRRSGWLPSPNPVLDRLEAAVDELEKAQVATLSGGKGLAARRNELLEPARAARDAYKGQVQEAVDANPDMALTIIASSGLGSRAASSRRKAPVTVKPGKVSGSVDIDVKAPVRDASYLWEFSVNGGKSYERAPSTKQSRTTITGLPPGQYVLVRFKVGTRKGEGDWSEPVEVLVK